MSEKRDLCSYIDDLWERIGRKLRAKMTVKDINKVIRQVRKQKSA